MSNEIENQVINSKRMITNYVIIGLLAGILIVGIVFCLKDKKPNPLLEKNGKNNPYLLERRPQDYVIIMSSESPEYPDGHFTLYHDKAVVNIDGKNVKWITGIIKKWVLSKFSSSNSDDSVQDEEIQNDGNE